MAQSFSLATKGANPKTNLASTIAGSLGLPANTSQQKPFYPTPTGQPIQQGTNTGLLTKPTTPQPTTPVKAVVSADGTKTEYHAPITKPADDPSNKYNTDTGKLNPNYKDPNAVAPTPTPAPVPKPTTFSGLIGDVANQQESSYNQIATQSAQTLQDISAQNPALTGEAFDAYSRAVEAQRKLKEGIAKQYGAIESQAIPLEFQQGREQALARQYAGQLEAGQGAITEQQQAINQAIAGLGQQQAGFTNAGNLALTGQATKQTGLLGAGGLAQPTQVSPTNVPFNPLTGEYGQPASSAYGAGGLATVGGIFEQQEQGAQTQNMIGAYNQAKPLIETAKQQIADVGFNISPLGLVNKLQQYVNKDVIPSGEYANIFNTLSEIATTISPVLGAQGAQTDLKTMIAQEFIPKLLQGQDIGMVLDNIEQNALAKIQANKATAQGTPLQVPSSGGNTGGSIWDF